MNASANTMIDCLPNLFMYQFEAYRPITAPIHDHTEIQSPYSMSSLPASTYTVVAAIFEYIIRYIPVAEETFGGTPIPIK